MTEPSIKPLFAPGGTLVGSTIQHGGRVYELPQYPKRIKEISEATDGTLNVQFEGGHGRILDPQYDAIVEAASSAGGSAGGHDPKAHGKIRYIVRAFGKWAGGKHSTCVSRIRTEHPEVAKGKNLNALCAWLKDQWAGTTKWRGKKSDPKQAAEGKAIMARAKTTAYARFSHAMPPLPPDALDALVEDVQKLTGIAPRDVLREMGGDTEDEIFAAIWETEVETSAAALTEVELALPNAVRRRQAGHCEALVETWLALHGRVETADPQTALVAAERIVARQMPLVGNIIGQNHGPDASSELEEAVTEALLREMVREPAVPLEEAFTEASVDPQSVKRIRCPSCTASQPITNARCTRDHCGHSLEEARRAALSTPKEGQMIESEVMARLGIDDDPAYSGRPFEMMVEEAVGLGGGDPFRLRQLSPNALGQLVTDLREAATKTAPCGHRIPKGSTSCPRCGVTMKETAQAPDGARMKLLTPEEVVTQLERADAGEWERAIRLAEADLGYTMRDEPAALRTVRLTHAQLPTIAVTFSEDRGGIEPHSVEIEDDSTRGFRESATDPTVEELLDGREQPTTATSLLKDEENKNLTAKKLAEVHRTIADVKPHLRVLGDGRIVPVSRHDRGAVAPRDEIRKRSEAVSKGNRTRAERRREAEHASDTDTTDTTADTDAVAQEAMALAREAAAKVLHGQAR